MEPKVFRAWAELVKQTGLSRRQRRRLRRAFASVSAEMLSACRQELRDEAIKAVRQAHKDAGMVAEVYLLHLFNSHRAAG